MGGVPAEKGEGCFAQFPLGPVACVAISEALAPPWNRIIAAATNLARRQTR